MNTPHTQGRLAYVERGDEYQRTLRDDNGNAVAILCSDAPVQKADARRLAACWNACIDIPTEALEQVEDCDTPVFQLLTQTWEERDTLLQHLQACVTGWQKGDDVVGPMHAAMALLAKRQSTIATRVRQDIARGSRQSNGKLPG